MQERAVYPATGLASELDEIAERLKNVARGEGEMRLGDLSPLRQGWHDRLTWAKATYKARQARKDFFDKDLFAEPAWDILLDLYVAQLERRQISVSSASIASGVPATTALRYIAVLEQRDLVRRVRADGDGRVCHIELTAAGRERMDRMFVKLQAVADTLPESDPARG